MQLVYLLIFLLCGLSCFGQTKVGYIDYDKVILTLPEHFSGKKKIESLRKRFEDSIIEMSNNFRNVSPKKIAILVGRGFSSYDAGEIWHLFDTRYNMKITKLDTDYASRVDLSKYTTIIANGSTSNKALENKLKNYLENSLSYDVKE